MKQRKIITLILLMVFVFAAVLLYIKTTKPKVDTWISLTIPENGKIVYKPSALFNDISLPEIKIVKDSCKFIDRDSGHYLGYKIDIDISHLDTTNVPKKYLRDRDETINGEKATALGLREVTYGISIEFTFFDKDNFELMEIKSKTETVTSGQENKFQNIVEKSIPIKIIEATKKIKLVTSIDTCFSCN